MNFKISWRTKLQLALTPPIKLKIIRIKSKKLQNITIVFVSNKIIIILSSVKKSS